MAHHTPANSSVRTLPSSGSISRTAWLFVSATYNRCPATINSKLGVETRTEAAQAAFQLGILAP